MPGDTLKTRKWMCLSRGDMHQQVQNWQYLKQHLDRECVLRKSTSQYCGSVGTVQERVKHLNFCNEAPVSCPNQCGERKVVRQDLKQHLQLCGLQVITCEYVEVGCRAPSMTRQDMLQHAQKEKEMHLKLVTCAYRSLKHTMEVVRAEAKNLTKSIASSCIKTCSSTARDVSKEKLWFRMTNVSAYMQQGKPWQSLDFKYNNYKLCLEVTISPKIRLTLCAVCMQWKFTMEAIEYSRDKLRKAKARRICYG